MQPDDILIQRIIRHEGFTPKAKPDAKGMDVIGYGHDVTPTAAEVNFPNGITESAALELLKNDLAQDTHSLFQKLPWVQQLSEIRQGILIEMCFQLGINGFLGFKDMLMAAQAGHNQMVSDCMLKSEWHTQTPSRCEELAKLWLDNPEPPKPQFINSCLNWIKGLFIKR